MVHCKILLLHAYQAVCSEEANGPMREGHARIIVD